MFHWYSSARGIGKNIYPIRVIGYWFGALVLLLYRLHLEDINWLSVSIIVIFFVYPHIGFWNYYRNNFESNFELRNLMFDTFLVGLFSSQMNFGLIPTVAFFAVIFSTVMGVNGVTLFLKCILTFLVGVTVAIFATGFEFDPNPPLLIQLLSVAYLLIGTISHNYFDFQRSLKFIAAKDLIKEQKIQIEQNLHEKEVLLREVHHRVKNNLQIIHSLLNLQQENISDPSASLAIKTSQNRIKIMSLVHQELYKTDDIKDVDISVYLVQLIDYLKALNEQRTDDIKVETQIEPISINLKTAVPLGLIMNEIISNSLEHAFDDTMADKKIWLNINRQNDFIKIEAGDNGCGIKKKRSQEQSSLGLNLIEDLVRQLKGKLQIETSEGVIFRIQFPLNND